MAMYSVSFAKHTLECSVIVVGVRGKPFVGEERRRVHELCAGLDGSLLGVEAVGLITCGEVELVRQVHTLFVRSAQQVVVFELQVRDEEEGVRQEVREVKGESKHGECARDDVLRNKTSRNRTMRAHAQTLWKSAVMVMSSLVYASCKVFASCKVTTQSCPILTFPLLVPIVNLLSGCML